jgi:hypothetical protein
LQSLGLSQQQIQAFDQVANLINALSPATFADLVSQLQTLAQQASQGVQSSTVAAPSTDTASTPSSPTAAATPAGTSDPTPAASTVTAATNGSNTSGTAQSTGPYQIEELSIKFSGVDVQGTTGGTNGSSNSAGGTFDFSAFNLSIQEVNVTLADGNGQTSQISTSQPPANNTASTTQTSAPAAVTAS